MAKQYNDANTIDGLNSVAGYVVERSAGQISPVDMAARDVVHAVATAYAKVFSDPNTNCFVGSRYEDTSRMREIFLGRADESTVWSDVVCLQLMITPKGYSPKVSLLFGKQRKPVEGDLERITEKVAEHIKNPSSSKPTTRKVSRAKIAALYESDVQEDF